MYHLGTEHDLDTITLVKRNLLLFLNRNTLYYIIETCFLKIRRYYELVKYRVDLKLFFKYKLENVQI